MEIGTIGAGDFAESPSSGAKSLPPAIGIAGPQSASRALATTVA